MSKVSVPKNLLQLPEKFQRGILKGARSAENTLKNGVRDSILQRWKDTGESAASIEAEVKETTGGNVRVVVRSGQPYDVFGEYGTGARGEENAPSFKPQSWNYGEKGGMKPRMAFHLGAAEALPDMLKDIATAIKSEMEK